MGSSLDKIDEKREQQLKAQKQQNLQNQAQQRRPKPSKPNKKSRKREAPQKEHMHAGVPEEKVSIAVPRIIPAMDVRLPTPVPHVPSLEDPDLLLHGRKLPRI